MILENISPIYDAKKVTVQYEVICPQPGGQTDFLSRPETEVLAGGAAGGGKSYALILDALGLQYQDTIFGIAAYKHPRYRAVIFRRTSTRLQNLIDLAKELYFPLGATFALQRKGEPGSSFTFPSRAKIFLCHLEMDSDIESHQGAAYQYIGFDELTQFTLKQYLYLFSRLRGVVSNNGMNITMRIRSTTNPTGEGLVWVRRRFIKNQSKVLAPGRTYFFISDPNADSPEDNPQGIEVHPGDPQWLNGKSRTFIPAFLYENKILMESDPGYAGNIMQLGKKMEAALLHGDWDAFGGDFFDMFDKNGAKEKPFDIPSDWQLVGALDPGWSSPCSFGLYARDFERHLHLIFTYYVRKQDPETHAKNIYSLIKKCTYTQGRMPDMIVSGRDAFQKKDRYAMNRTELTLSDIFNSHGMYLQPAVTDRVIGWWTVKQYFANKMFHYFDGYNDPFIDEVTSCQTDEDNVEDIKGLGNDPNVPDHALDQLRYGCMAIPYPFTKGQELLPTYEIYNSSKRGRKRGKNAGTTVMSV